MAGRQKRPSPILGAASTMIGEASSVLVTRGSRFRHTFEAQVETIGSDPGQARKVFEESEIRSLAATMMEQGQLQPILLRADPASKGRWIIVAGERRWRAAVQNGWKSILAIEHDGDPEVASLLENLQRVDLTPVEEASGLQRLIKEKGWSQAAAAASLGRSKAEVSATLRILTLPVDLLKAVLTSELTIAKNVLIELARVEDAEARERLLSLAWAKRLTVRAIRDVLENKRKRGLSTPATGDRLKPRTIDRLIERLRAASNENRQLEEGERERLVRLMRELERRLASDEERGG